MVAVACAEGSPYMRWRVAKTCKKAAQCSGEIPPLCSERLVAWRHHTVQGEVMSARPGVQYQLRKMPNARATERYAQKIIDIAIEYRWRHLRGRTQ